MLKFIKYCFFIFLNCYTALYGKEDLPSSSSLLAPTVFSEVQMAYRKAFIEGERDLKNDVRMLGDGKRVARSVLKGTPTEFINLLKYLKSKLSSQARHLQKILSNTSLYADAYRTSATFELEDYDKELFSIKMGVVSLFGGGSCGTCIYTCTSETPLIYDTISVYTYPETNPGEYKLRYEEKSGFTLRSARSDDPNPCEFEIPSSSWVTFPKYDISLEIKKPLTRWNQEESFFIVQGDGFLFKCYPSGGEELLLPCPNLSSVGRDLIPYYFKNLEGVYQHKTKVAQIIGYINGLIKLYDIQIQKLSLIVPSS